MENAFSRGSFALAPERVIDVRQGTAARGLAVVVEGERIAAVLPAAALPAEIPVEKLPGCALLPGFIDVHAHVEDWELPILLAHGITTVRDTGNELDYILGKRDEMTRPGAAGPAIVCCGPALDGIPYWHPLLNWGIANADDMELAIRYLAGRGVDAIKLYVGLDSARVSRAVETCSRLGLHLLGHFLPPVSLLEAVKLGISEAEHFAGAPSTFDRLVVDTLVDRSAWSVPTQMVWEAVLKFADDPARWNKLSALAPRGPITVHRENYAKKIADDAQGRMRLEAMCRVNRQYIAAVAEKEGRLAPGTDAPALLSFPGASYQDELDVFADCGMSVPRILRSATFEAARLLRIDDRTGCIEAGKVADLLLVDGNPLADLAAVRRVRRVYKRGYRYEPEALIRSSNPPAMRTGILPDISERAREMEDWKTKYLARRA